MKAALLKILRRLEKELGLDPRPRDEVMRMRNRELKALIETLEEKGISPQPDSLEPAEASIKTQVSEKPPVSVVIVTFNRSYQLLKTLEALKPQLRPGDDVVVTDDGSDDGTMEMVRKLPWVRYFRQDRKGWRLASARNKGIINARHEITVILDADCEPQPGLLDAYREAMRPGVACLGDVLFEKDSSGLETERIMVGAGNMCFNKSEARVVGFFTEAYDGAWGYEDRDFIMKLKRSGVRVDVLRPALVIHRWHPTPKDRDIHANKSKLDERISDYLESKFPPVTGVDQENILIIVDVYGWAWDIASKELLKSLPDVRGKIVSVEEFTEGRIQPDDYGIVLVYPWSNKDVMDRLSPENTVVCVAGGDQLDMRLLFENNCSRFKFLGACNRSIQKVLRDRYPDKKVTLLSHGVDTKLFKPRPKPKEEFIIGWAGATSRPLKRFMLAKLISYEVGVDLKLAGFIKEEGRIPHEEMPDFLNSINCLLVTSEAEAHPLVVYEAMACGLPVVSTKVGDVEENIRSGVNGFLLDVNAKPQEYVEVINRLREDPDLREKMGRRAREIILRKWQWPNIAKQYTDLLELILTEREASPRLRASGKVKLLMVLGSTMIGGAEKQVLRLINNLDQDTYDVNVLTPLEKKGELHEEFEAVSRIEYFTWGHPWKDKIAGYVNEGGYDVVHFINFEQLYPEVVNFKPHIRVVVTIFKEIEILTRTEERKAFIDRYYFDEAIRSRVDVWTTDSEANREYCPHFNIVPFGIDTDKFKPRWKKRKSVAWVSRIRAAKRAGIVIHLARALPDYVFHIICGVNLPADQKNFEALEKKAPSNVKLYKNLPSKEVAKILGSSQFFLMPSESESLSVALMEAMMSGCVPICTPVGETPNIIIDGVNGYLIPFVQSGGRVANYLVKHFKDFDARLGKAARRTAERLWDIRARTKNIEFLYGHVRRNEIRMAFITTYYTNFMSLDFWLNLEDSMHYSFAQMGNAHSSIVMIPHKEKGIIRRVINGYNAFFYEHNNWNHLFQILDDFMPNVMLMNMLDPTKHRPIISRYPDAYKATFEYGGDFKNYLIAGEIDRMFVQQEFRRQECVDVTGLPLDRVVTNTFCVDAMRFRPMDIEKSWDAVMVADFRPKLKRQHLLIEAWRDVPGRLLLLARLNQPEIYGKYEQHCRRLIKKLDLEDRIDIKEFVTHRDLPALLNKCKVGVMTSSREGGSRSQLEMMASGLPMIVMDDCAGAFNLVEPREGLVVSPTPKAIAEAVKSLLNNEKKRVRMGLRASKRVRRELNYDTMLGKFEDMVNDALIEVTVITTSMNKGAFIEECVDSVDRQRAPLLKVNHLIVDAGSTDETMEVLNRLASKVRVYVNEGQSQTSSLNWAMEKVGEEFPGTKYIGWLNADDKYLDNWMQESLKAIGERMYPMTQSEVDMTSSQYNLIAKDGSLKQPSVEPWGAAQLPDKVRIEDFKGKNTIVQPTVLIRRSSFERLREETGFYWNPEYEYTQDYELWGRMLKSGLIIQRIRKPLACLRHYEGQMSRLRRDEQIADFNKLRDETP